VQYYRFIFIVLLSSSMHSNKLQLGAIAFKLNLCEPSILITVLKLNFKIVIPLVYSKKLTIHVSYVYSFMLWNFFLHTCLSNGDSLIHKTHTYVKMPLSFSLMCKIIIKMLIKPAVLFIWKITR